VGHIVPLEVGEAASRGFGANQSGHFKSHGLCLSLFMRQQQIQSTLGGWAGSSFGMER
jgi:hypothetical protein